MDAVTVNWNGPTTVQGATEIPDESLTAGEYLAALVDAHQIPGVGHEFVMADGEPVPDDLDIGLLSGLTVTVRADAAETDAEVIDDEPKPYDQWTKAALVQEVQNRRDAGETIDVAKRAKPDALIAALELNDRTRADAVFVGPDGEQSTGPTIEQGAEVV